MGPRNGVAPAPAVTGNGGGSFRERLGSVETTANQTPKQADHPRPDHFEVTFFCDRAAATAEQKRTNLWDLRDRVLNTSGKAKEALPWLKLATFGDKRSGAGSLRTNENVTAISGVE